MNYADMSAKKLLEVLNDLGEQDTLEAKSLHEDTSRSVLETVCSFSNEPGLGGGVILIGVAECKSADGSEYVVDGVEDADKAQLDLATQCKSVFNLAVFPEIKVEQIGRKKVLKVVVDELPAKRKPLYFKKDGLLGLKGSVTRNDTIARVCHDTKLAETKGSGVDRMWQMMTAAGLSRPTMESDRLAETFTIRLLLHQFMDEGTLNWLKHFAAYPLNADQRTALVFLREVGAVDALSYRQLTGCPAKRVTKDLAGLKESGLTIRKGRTSGTYYVPSEVLISAPQGLKSAPRNLISAPQTTTPRVQTTTPQAQTTTPWAQTTTPPGVITTPPSVITTPQGAITIPSEQTDKEIPDDLLVKLSALKKKNDAKYIADLIVELCSCRPMTKGDLMVYLKRSEATINRAVAKLLNRRLDYLYPMMVHHPNQAYVALTDDEHREVMS